MDNNLEKDGLYFMLENLIQSKENNLKVYGLTQDASTDEYVLVFDFKKRDVMNGNCASCNRYNTSPAWCQLCDPQKTTQGWTSGNEDVDNCINEFQLKATNYQNVIEWIPFSRLDNVQKIGEGGFCSVFSTTWLDGKRILSVESKIVQSRTPSCVVALKTLSGSQKNFLREFKSYTEFRLVGRNFEVYGLTQNTTNNEYLMQLVDISKNLKKVHEAGYVHGDFHSGNILQNQYINGNLISYIADLGLSRKNDESDLEDSIYGVLPYVAPEVLNRRPYTIAADIYSFGVIMAEISTGRPPHYNIEYDEALAIKICNGLRPELAKGTSECYIKLANQCMDANPSNRPTALYICDELSRWYKIVYKGTAEVKDELVILKAFQFADAIIPTLSTELPICSKDKFTSKLLNFKNLSEPINSSFIPPVKLLNICDSTTIDFSISDNDISPKD
ncbi:kinase-like domain-containing protein [Gigaspora rosea]|uniref:Kinase-like domain-containing protein n=1 Tax=Gigaspora rosea TaxID=44941 RepID=A0A397WDB4_9GLOM|nr:kinase-like domain-containing protein [Gigaspora rosea]